jgi:hypothetical protein
MTFKIVDDATASEIESEVEALEEAGNDIEGVTLIHVNSSFGTQRYTAVIKYQPPMDVKDYSNLGWDEPPF